MTSAQNNSGVDKLFHDMGNKFLDPNFQEKVNDAKVDKEKVQNTVKLDTNNVKEKNKEQEKQKKKGFC